MRPAGQLAARLARLTGSGAVAVHNVDGDGLTRPGIVANSLVNSGSTGPTMGSYEDKAGIRIKHREYVQQIFGGAGGVFTNNTFVVNPGLGNVFPFLSSMAALYEQYRFHGLVFEFVSATAPYGATSLGTWSLAAEYNAAAPPYKTMPAMNNSDYAISARLDNSGLYAIECAPGSQATNYLYIRAPGLTVGAGGTMPTSLCDVALMQMGTLPGSTITAGSMLGELWVSYDVELIRPRIPIGRFATLHQWFGNYDDETGLPSVVPTVNIGNSTLTGAGFTTGGNFIFPGAGVGDVYELRISWISDKLVAAGGDGIEPPTPVSADESTSFYNVVCLAAPVALENIYAAGAVPEPGIGGRRVTVVFQVVILKTAVQCDPAIGSPNFTWNTSYEIILPVGPDSPGPSFGLDLFATCVSTGQTVAVN